MAANFTKLVDQLERLAQTATIDNALQSELRQLLTFLTVFVQVADQPFSDVLAVLIEFKYLTVQDYRVGKVREPNKELEPLTSCSKYGDAEEICSHLHHLL